MVKKKVVSKKRKSAPAVLDPIFIPINFDSYRENKMNLLNAQVKALECVKAINHIRELQKYKEQLKLQLYRDLSSVLELYYKVQDSLPEVSNPSFMKKIEQTVEVAVKYKQEESFVPAPKLDEVDSELREIQEKLNSLNSSKNRYN